MTNSLANGSSIGLFMKNVNESDVVQYDIRNEKFTASATEEGQDWQPEQIIYLNKALCNVNAYYPYNEDVTNIEAIPVESSTQTDYMYAGNTIQVNAENRQATLEMEHALSVITLTIKKGTYTGAGNISKVGLRGSGIAKAAKLNGKTGELADITGADEMLCQDVTMTMDESGQAIHTLFVPNPVTSNVKISLWVDGNEYYVITPGTLFDQGYRYEYTLTVDEGSLNISAVHVGDWGYDQLGNPVLWAGNHRVTLQGDLEKIAFNTTVTDGEVSIEAKPLADIWVPTEVSVTDGATIANNIDANNGAVSVRLSDITKDVTVTIKGYIVSFEGDNADIALGSSVSGNTVTIKAISIDGYIVNEVSVSYGATLTQSVSGKTRVITLTDISSNVTVTFNGYNGLPDAIADNWTNLSDGIYAIRPDGKPAYASLANEFCSAGFVVKGKVYQVAKVDATGYNGSETVYWHISGGGDVGGLANFTYCGGGNTNTHIDNNHGYLTGSTSPQLSRNPYTWSNGALSEFNGQTNTANILAAQSNGTIDNTIGKAVMVFRSSSNNEGYNDWFIPACGELAYMYLKMTELNTLLGKVSGTALSGTYWSSTEYGYSQAWPLNFDNGRLDDAQKNGLCQVRLVRAIVD